MSDFNGRPDELPIYLFNEGTNYRSYETLGVHRYNNGWSFAVWAPAAASVAVACDANGWTGAGMELSRTGSTGVWYGATDKIGEGEV